MSLLKDLEHAAKDIEHEVDSIGAEIDKDMQKAIDAVTSGLANIQTLLEQGFEAAEQALIEKVRDDAKKEYADTIGKLRTLSTEGITSAIPESIENDVRDAFKNANGTNAVAVLSNLATDTMKAAFPELTAFSTLTLSTSAEADLGAGVATSAGGGVRMTDLSISECRMLMDFDVSGGAEEGADLGLSLGLWKDKPKDLQGGFIACTLGADLVVGTDVIIYLSMEFEPKFIGVVLDLTAGEELEESIAFGFTLAFKVVNAPVGMPMVG